MRIVTLLALVAAAGLAAPHSVEKQMHARVPMRDGVWLCANVFRPGGLRRAPTLLVRTPYGKGADISANYRAFVEHGYNVVVQDVRGRYHSQGVFEPLRQEANDGEDTLNWIAAQPWSEPKIGMLGGSYLGIVQWKVAVRNNPYLKAISPTVSGSDDYRDRFFSAGGAMKLGQRLLWMSENLRAPGFNKPDFNTYILHLPLRTADRAATGQRAEMYQTALDHPAYDEFWRSLSVRERLADIRVPVLAIGGWYDNFVASDFEAFAGLRNSAARRLVTGPWPHNMSVRFREVDFGPQSKLPVRQLQLEWFDHWLKKPGAERKPAPGPPLRIFVMGVNHWREERSWPLERARPKSYYLHSKGKANSLGGDGELRTRSAAGSPPDSFVFDPRTPVPTRGGPVCCNPEVFPWGPLDQREVEKRSDVLVYTSAPLKRDLEVTGPIRVRLHVSTSAPDTDFTAKLVDVFPGGQARNLCDGILRLRYRRSLSQPELARPGEVYAIEIDAGVTSNVFLAGHRIRLEVSSSNFPRFDRNPNTGRPVAIETELRTARQTVYHNRRYPSCLILPVTPSGKGKPQAAGNFP